MARAARDRPARPSRPAARAPARGRRPRHRRARGAAPGAAGLGSPEEPARIREHAPSIPPDAPALAEPRVSGTDPRLQAGRTAEAQRTQSLAEEERGNEVRTSGA